MTIKDIAKESGYAVGTVSRVLNNHPDVSEQARKRILAVVEKNGYIQNTNAKNLKQMVNRSILVLVKGTRNELFAALVEKLQGLLNNSPYTLLADYFDEDTDEVLRAITLCAEKKPQGILFLGGNADNFRQSFGRIALPAVLVTSPAEGLEFPNLSSVTTDDFEASVQAVQVLLDRGHRHIAIIGFDGLALGEYLTPRLATIGQSVERLAQEATATLLDAIETGAPARRVTVPFTVINGESVGDAPAV